MRVREAIGSWLVMLLLIMAMEPGAKAIEADFRGVSGQILIHADPKCVYEAIKSLRNPGGTVAVEVLSDDGNTDVLKETFTNLPVIGTAVCQYREIYKPFESIEYKMITSDHFKAFEGRWLLQQQGPDGTLVKLSSYVEPDLKVPFVHQLTNFATMRDIHKRLDTVKKICESRDQITQR